MKNRKVKVLAVVSYEAMKTTIERLASDRSDLELDVYVGNSTYGKELVQRHSDKNYDAILSQGETARLIEAVTDIPVIEIPLSVYDILRSMKLAENYQEKYAIVGFSSTTDSAYMLCNLLNNQVDIFTIHSTTEIRPLLTRLQTQGYYMVVCDMTSHTEAISIGLNAILITSGTESIIDAFEQVVKISSDQIRIRKENQLIKDILKNSSNHTVVFDSEENIYFSTWDKQNEAELYELLRGELPHVHSLEHYKIFRNMEGTLFSIIGYILPCEGEEYTAFYFTESNIPITLGKYGIHFSNQQEEKEHFFNSFYNIAGIIGNLSQSIEKMSQTTFPVIITGEMGAGKEQIARALYIKSPLNKNPLVTIDCTQLTEKGWNFLTNHHNSPFSDNNNTIYFKNIDALDSERSHHLLSSMIDTNLHHRNRLIFSCVSQSNAPLPTETQNFIKRLSCLSIFLPPLREQIHELPTLSSVYLSTLNIKLGKQLMGFDSKAMDIMMHYEWPENYTQLKRITRDLAILTDTPYITSHLVTELLEKERCSIYHSCHSFSDSSMNLERPLEEITRDIIKKALSNNNGNQSLTARQLQISRTTLWRYLKY